MSVSPAGRVGLLVLLAAVGIPLSCERSPGLLEPNNPTASTNAAEPTPVSGTFGSRTTAPWTVITFGPQYGQWWCPDVEFEWEGFDNDGVVVGYKYAVSTADEYRWDTGDPYPNSGELGAWLDTLTFRPLEGGGYSTERVWKETEEDSVVFWGLPETSADPTDYYLFGIHAIDDEGFEESGLVQPRNFRTFNVSNTMNGPRLVLASNLAGTFRLQDPTERRDVFSAGICFQWLRTPGPAGHPVTGYSYAIDDTTSGWSPFDPNLTEWPPAGSPPWYPDAGPSGVDHSFFLRASDEAGYVSYVEARLRFFDGPRHTPFHERLILVVLDTDASTLMEDGIFPRQYPEIEEDIVSFYFRGFGYQIHKTAGVIPPPTEVLNRATSVCWLHSCDLTTGADQSVLKTYHIDPSTTNILESYVAAGGNLLICGINPCEAMRYYEDAATGQRWLEPYPVEYYRTVTDPTARPHWVFTQLGIRRIEDRVLNTSIYDTHRRLRVVTSEMACGANPYPDLHFDPMCWPNGPQQRGFGFYDYNVEPELGVAEILYTLTDTGIPVGIRKFIGPGVNGNAIYLGFHPYFVQRREFREFVLAALHDFGERRINAKTLETATFGR
jgi:hypothetical protein